MLIRKITTTGNSAALVLSQDLLGLMGLAVGDEVELQLVDRTLLVRPRSEAEQAQRVHAAMEDVLHRRKRLLTKLAEGPQAAKDKTP